MIHPLIANKYSCVLTVFFPFCNFGSTQRGMSHLRVHQRLIILFTRALCWSIIPATFTPTHTLTHYIFKKYILKENSYVRIFRLVFSHKGSRVKSRMHSSYFPRVLCDPPSFDGQNNWWCSIVYFAVFILSYYFLPHGFVAFYTKHFSTTFSLCHFHNT